MARGPPGRKARCSSLKPIATLQMDGENTSLQLSLVPPLPSRATAAPQAGRPSAQAQRGTLQTVPGSVGF